MGDKFFNLSLIYFGERIGDLCSVCFARDFALLVVYAGVVDPTCVFCLDFNIGSLSISNLLPSWYLVKFSRE